MILIIDDDIAVRTSLSLLLKSIENEIVIIDNPTQAFEVVKLKRPELVILDLNFSIDTSGKEGMTLLQKIRAFDAKLPIILITGWASIELAVQGMKLGANDFINKPWNNEYVLQSVETLLALNGKKVISRSRKEIDKKYNFKQIIGEDPSLLAILETIGRVASTNAAVLITGESGTGKELIAEAIHENSNRISKPFVKVNLGGISSSLFESEMFGHVRGAFTDARFDRTGRFEMANKGTIFLDEIGDLEASSQVKLLRVLQDRTYEVLGSSRTKTVDTRVVCATNKNLNEMVASGLFREDLLYRINLITIHLPALRERPSDIPLLVNFFINNMKVIYKRPDLSISPAAMRWLQKLALPGNIRQLKNLVERTILISQKDELGIDEFQSQLNLSPLRNEKVRLPGVGVMTLDQMEAEMVKQAMNFHKNRITKAAASLGITRNALYRRLEKHQIPFNETED
ncbi:DNA-binding transcriptional response regulator, NtrC family, contains REC, AAA-type ATPase, and a Fis-type DNA-binding domains [Pedobacter terrae]|uniref:DNA-binding transcriptional response regulator, NtrC family, contains REC, AAA-type ATPase, and a Fis-type DNA-binding domains n=1 Tax=Pedobacter terrae TaxID=405671 RepID=A0A1G7WPK6_9SPHI|nr:sigma-54 dependent transcriptional regulator [Pedobacter terrae]SDG73814.1 DNA-binding transcriptional response regulator, NtrC family, contains REC, AAA-type ATPase, and a Fis-type DNA-binding domains [Pedobacter terrae]